MSSQLSELKPEAPALHELAVRVQQGDKEAFGAIYQQLVEDVFGFLLRRLANRAQAEDITSETFFVALERIHQYRGPNFKYWLFAIAHASMCHSFRRTRGEIAIGDSRAYQLDTPDVSILSNPDRVWAYNERVLAYNALLRRLNWALRELTPGQLECIRLRFFENLKLSEVAARMGRNANATAALQFRGLQALADALYTSW